MHTNTPSYGNRNKFEQIKKSDISKGDVANDTTISTTVHIGTHIDMPYHFYENGQTIEEYEPDFWIFQQKEILFIEITVDNEELVVNKSLIERLEAIKNNSQISTLDYKLLIVKTGICNERDQEGFWSENHGFHGDIYDYLVETFPNIKVFGFDSISVSSFQNRTVGRDAHKRFLNPKKPVLLLEDMDLRKVGDKTIFKNIIISPLRISQCDALPCTVLGFLND